MRNKARRIAGELTSAGEEDFDGDILQQVAAREDRADFGKVPFSVQVVAVLQHLEQKLETRSLYPLRTGDIFFRKSNN